MLSALKIDIELPKFSLEVVFGLQSLIIVLLGGSDAPASTWYLYNIDNNSCVDSKIGHFGQWWQDIWTWKGDSASCLSPSLHHSGVWKKEERLLNIIGCKKKKMQPCGPLLPEPPPVCPSGYRRMGPSKLPASKASICAEVRPFPRCGHTCHGTITGFERTYAALSMAAPPQGLVLLFRVMASHIS